MSQANLTVIWSDIDAGERRAVFHWLRSQAAMTRMVKRMNRGALPDIMGPDQPSPASIDALANLLAAQDPACAELSRRGE